MIPLLFKAFCPRNALKMVKNEQREEPGQPVTKLYVPPSFRSYDHRRADRFEKQFSQDLLRSEHALYDNGVPLTLFEKLKTLVKKSNEIEPENVKIGDNGKIKNKGVVMPLIFNGDNWADVILDLALANGIIQDKEYIGPNADHLALLLLFADHRLDKVPTRLIPGLPNQYAIVERQSSLTVTLAGLSAYIAGVHTIAQIDGHGHIATNHFNQVGIEVINLTTATLMIQELIERKLLDDNLKNVIVGVDFGNVPLTHDMAIKFGFELAIIRKFREMVDDRGATRTRHELFFNGAAIKGARPILMDDMIDSGGTLVETVKMLIDDYGAAEVLVCASHPVFGKSGYYAKIQRLLGNRKVKIVMTSDSLPVERPGRGGNKSVPYIQLNGGENQRKRRLQKLKIGSLAEETLRSLLKNGKDIPQIKADLADHIFEQRNPYELVKEITGLEVEEPEVTHSYQEGGTYVQLTPAQRRKKIATVRRKLPPAIKAK